MNIQVIQVIIEILILLIGLYLAFFKSYVEEKGKNLATKEDIEDITRKIENVRGDIEILTYHKINLSTIKQESLLDINSKYFAWLNCILNTPLTNPPSTYDSYLLKNEEKLSQLFHDYSISEANMEVFFVDDIPIIQLKNQIKIKTIELSNSLKQSLHLYHGEAIQLNLVNELPNIPPDNTYKMSELAVRYEKIRVISNDFRTDILAKYTVLSKLNHEMNLAISKIIHNPKIQ